MLDNFQDNVELLTNKALTNLRIWKKKEDAEDIIREYLSEEGMITKSSSKLQELLDEKHRMALSSTDEPTKLKAIDSSLAMAAGNRKMIGTQNNQFNFGKFLDDIPEK